MRWGWVVQRVEEIKSKYGFKDESVFHSTKYYTRREETYDGP